MNKQEREIRWYRLEGWRTMNFVLSRRPGLKSIYVENFDSTQKALEHISRKSLVKLFNEDSVSWVLQQEKDGTLIAKAK